MLGSRLLQLIRPTGYAISPRSASDYSADPWLTGKAASKSRLSHSGNRTRSEPGVGTHRRPGIERYPQGLRLGSRSTAVVGGVPRARADKSVCSHQRFLRFITSADLLHLVFFAASDFQLDAETVVALFSQMGRIDQAFSAGRAFDCDLSALFEALTERCVALSTHESGYVPHSQPTAAGRDADSAFLLQHYGRELGEPGRGSVDVGRASSRKGLEIAGDEPRSP